MKIIKDRHAKTENRNNVQLETRMTLEEMRGQEQGRGQTAEQFASKGVEKDPGRKATGGVPSFMPGPADDAPKALLHERCSELTLKGDPCQAYPVTGTSICVGHARQL